MSINQHVTVNLKVSNPGVAQQGFGLIGLVSYKALWPERLRLYARASDAITDGFAADSPECVMLGQVFAQSPRPPTAAILRGTRPPTQRYSLNVTAIRNLFAYKINVKGEGVTPTQVLYTSDANATDGEIVAGLVAALNAVVGKNYLAANAVSPFVVTAAAPGNWFTLEVLDTSALSIIQNHANPGIETDLAEIAIADNSWYWLYTTFNSSAVVLAAAAWIEANGRMYLPDVVDSASENVAIGGGDILDVLPALSYKRTLPSYHRKPNEVMGASWEGELAPNKPGSYDAAYKELAGVTADKFTETQFANLTAKRASYYKSEFGRSFTFEGKVGSATYGFMDVTISLDFVLNLIQTRLLGLRLAVGKLAYTDEDIALASSVVEGVLDECKSDKYKIVARGTPGDPNDPVPVVSFPRVKDIDPSVRALRNLPNGAASFRIQGSIDHIDVDLGISF